MQRERSSIRSLRVLLMGRPEHATVDIARRLGARGHSVVRCHDPGKPPFPCHAIDGTCPLDEQPVDVAVLLRDEAWPRPTSFDRGATCAIRQRTPVVLVGTPVLNPYDRWVDEILPLSGDVTGAVERAATGPRAEHSRIATEALRAALEAAQIPPGEGAAEVDRHADRLIVRIRFPEGVLQGAREQAVHRVIRDLRSYDPDAWGIDVSVVAAERLLARDGS